MTDLEVAKRIAEEVAEAGGRTYYVGGCVEMSFYIKQAKISILKYMEFRRSS